MNETDKVIIALGFFTLVGFIAFMYFLKTPNPNGSENMWVLPDLKKEREARASVAKW